MNSTALGALWGFLTIFSLSLAHTSYHYNAAVEQWRKWRLNKPTLNIPVALFAAASRGLIGLLVGALTGWLFF